jgi:hypothetical protein
MPDGLKVSADTDFSGSALAGYLTGNMVLDSIQGHAFSIYYISKMDSRPLLSLPSISKPPSPNPAQGLLTSLTFKQEHLSTH